MDSLLRPLLYLGLGLILGVGGHAAFQSVSTTAPAQSSAISTAQAPSEKNIPELKIGARALGTDADLSKAGKSEAYNLGQKEAAQDPGAVLAKLNSMAEGKERDEYLQGVFSALGLSDPTNAMTLALQLEDPRLQSMAVQTLALAWAFDSGTLASKDSLSTAMLGAVVALASTNPEKAALLAQTNLEGRSQMFALMSVAKQWARTDPEGALAWASSLDPSDRESSRLAGETARRVAETDPQLVAGYLDKITDEQTRLWTTSQVAEKWSEKDPKAAASWAVNLKEANAQSRAVHTVAREWAQIDYQAAAAWAKGLGDEKLSLAAARGVAREWGENDPQAAMQYASSIAAGDSRNAVLQSLAEGWASIDRDAAKAWAAALPVEAERKAVLESLANRGGRNRGGGGGGF